MLATLFVASTVLLGQTDACSNMIVSPGASADGSSIISYNADSASLYGSLYHYPAADHAPGTMRDIWDWDSGVYLGQIAEAEHTYNVVGNMNEFGLVIGETTYGGVSSLQHQPGAKIDYGSLIWVTLQRAKTAREAIHTMSDLMSTYGYYSEGESFSIGDKNEVWIMEVIGKGEYEKGAVWVARRIPDGHVSGHANQARITTFPLDSPEDTLYAPDVITFARKIGLYPADPSTAPDSAFSFSDVYDAVTFSGARFCEARVWTMFGTVLADQAWNDQYLDYAQGFNLTNRMPLWVKPAKPVSSADVMEIMRSHYEGTWFDMTGVREPDAGAMESHVGYRWRPLTWPHNDLTYVNERAIATQQTGWNFVAESRASVPDHLAGVLWFAVDESATSAHFPIYGSARRVPKAFAGQGAQDGVTTPILSFSMDNAFSVFNLVANWAYSRWDTIYPEVHAKIVSTENAFREKLHAVEAEAIALHSSKGVDASIEHVTAFSETCGNDLVHQWGSFFGYLFTKFRDGYNIAPSDTDPACGCAVGDVAYSTNWYDRIVNDTGERYLDPTSVPTKQHQLKAEEKPAHLRPVPKTSLKALK